MGKNSHANSKGYSGIIPRAERKKVQSSKIELITDNDGGVGLKTIPDNLSQPDWLPDFTTTLGNTAAIVTTNCVRSPSNKIFSWYTGGQSSNFTLSIKAQDNSFTSRGSFRMQKDSPWLWIMGDQSVPEVVEGSDGKVVGVTRVEDASFDSLRNLISSTLPRGKQVFPAGSIILVSVPVELSRVDVSAFLALYEDFEKWLCTRLHYGRDPDSNTRSEEVEKSKYVILPIFPPTNDEAMLHRIAQINNNTKLKLTKFPASHTESVMYQLLIDASQTCEKSGAEKRTVKLGPLPVHSPGFSASRAFAVSSEVSVRIPTNKPYMLDANLRAPGFIPELLDILKKIRPDLSIPCSRGLNQGQILMMKPAARGRVKSVAPTKPVPRGGLSADGRIFVIGQSNANKIANFFKTNLNFPENVMEYHKVTAPLNDYKMTRLQGYLDAIKLKKGDTVVLDLTCNFAPAPQKGTNDMPPLTTGEGKSRQFHLCDSKKRKLIVPSDNSVDALINRIVGVTNSMTTKGVLVVNLAPMPRHQQDCCADQSHGLESGGNPGSLNSLLRDIGVYMSRTIRLNRFNHLDLVLSPMDCSGPSVFCRLQTCKDQVHPSVELLARTACAILEARRISHGNGLPRARSMLESTISFSDFRSVESKRRAGGVHIPDDAFVPVTLHGRSLGPIPLSLGNQL